MADNIPGLVTVPLKSSWYSKINWAQALGMVATGLTVLGIDVPPETQVHLIAGIQGIVALSTWVMRTWFTKSIIPASL